MSGDFPVQHATHLPDWLAGGLLRCCAARLSMCRCCFPKSTSTTCYGHPCSILVRHIRHARFSRDLILARMSRGCYEENCCRGILAIAIKANMQGIAASHWPHARSYILQRAVAIVTGQVLVVEKSSVLARFDLELCLLLAEHVHADRVVVRLLTLSAVLRYRRKRLCTTPEWLTAYRPSLHQPSYSAPGLAM